MNAITSPLTALKLVSFTPKPVFETLKEQNRWSWWPFLLQMVAFALLMGLYFGLVDWPWYQQQHVLPALQGMSSSEQEIALEFSSRSNVLISSLVGLLLGTSLINACFAFYLSKITQLDEDNIQTFGDWFGLLWWTNLPLIISVVLGLIALLLGGTQASPTSVLAPLSITNLLQLDSTSTMGQFAASLSVLTLWVIWLQYHGVRTWTTLTPMMSWLIVLLPYVLVYGAWLMLL